MNKGFIFLGIFISGVLIFSQYSFVAQGFQLNFFSSTKEKSHMFEVQSIDTMKYSRDMAGQILNDPHAFDKMIDGQMSLIANTGATHVAIDTPYDDHFIPVLTEWVTSARQHHLSVWFRGNFSGWEGWFNYSKIDRDTHKILLASFIQKNPTLFLDGDILTPCPECENGAAGDPRQTGDKDGYNAFLVEEKKIADSEFSKEGKLVTVYTSMNADIAREIITPETAHALGGTILIDHYVNTNEKFTSDIASIPKKFSGKIGIGEMGAPVPDLNGDMTDSQQASYVQGMMDALYAQSDILPVVNYWVLTGGSTAIVNDDGSPKPAYKVLQKYFTAPKLSGITYNSLGESLHHVKITVASSTYTYTTTSSSYQVFLPTPLNTVIFSSEGYSPFIYSIGSTNTSSLKKNVYLEPINPSSWYSIRFFFHQFTKK